MEEKQGNSAVDVIWGVNAIGKVIGRTNRQTFHMCQKGELPVRKVGGRWMVERSVLVRFLKGEAA